MKRFTAVIGGILCLYALFPLGALAAPSQPARPATHAAAAHVTSVQPGAQATASKKNKPQAVKPKPVMYPTRPLWQKEHPAADPGIGQGDLNYYGGTTLNHPVTYLIFWGASWNAADAGTKAIILSYFNNLPGTSFDNLLSQYFDTAGNVAPTETLGGTYVDTTAPPTDNSCGLHPTVEDSSIIAEVGHAISVNGWPSDGTNATYFVYTPSGIYVNGGFGACSAYVFCAYHNYSSNTFGSGVAYAAMPYPVLSSCPALQSPNGNPYGDSLVSVSSHEEFESITDQFPCGAGCPNTGWVDNVNYEIGDKCAWDFASGYTHLGSGTYFIQEEYSNAIHGCTNTYTIPGSPHMLLGSSAGINQLTQTAVSPPSQTLTLDNNGAATLNWSSNTLPSWVSLTPSSGSLAPGSTASLSVSYNVTSPTPQTYSTTLVLSGNADNAPLTLPVVLTAIAPPGNDNIASATNLSTLPAYTSVDTTFATTEGTDPALTNCGPFSGANQYNQSVWYKYTTGAATGLRIDTVGSSYTTIAAVFTGTPGSLTQVACSFTYRGTRWSLVNFNASASTTYYIEVVAPFTPFPGSLFNDQLNLSVSTGPIVSSTIGVYRPSTSTFYLRDSNSTGGADINVTYGASGDQPVVGDWNYQGYDTIGIWRSSAHTFYLRNSDSAGPADFTTNTGSLGGTPLVGDWFGFGQAMLGLYNPTTSTFTEYFLTYNQIVTQFQFGAPGDIPVVGDWTGQGFDSVGVYRPSNQTFYLDTCNCPGGTIITATFGPAGAKPVVGDWTNKGYDSIGVMAGGTFYLRNSNSTGFADNIFSFGAGSDTPLAGRWTPLPGAPFKPPHHEFSPFGPTAAISEH